KGKGRKAGIRMERKIKVPIDDLERPKSWGRLPEDFGDAINIVQHCAGKDVQQLATTCVHIHPKWIETLDGYQVIRYRVKTGVEEPILVRKDSIRHIIPLAVTKFCITETWAHFKNANGTTIS